MPRRDRPSVLPARAQLDAGRHRLPPSQAFGLGQQGERLVGVERHEHGFLCSHNVFSSSGRVGGREYLELVGPEHIECVAERRHTVRVESVVAESPLLASMHQSCIGQHPQML